MSKKIILLILILLLTGCSGTYELEIKNEKVIEKTTALYDSSKVVGDPYEYTKKLSLKYDDNGDFLSYETKKNISKKDKTGVELTNKYDSIEEFKEESKIINYCYIARSITNYENDYLTLKTSSEFTCFRDVEELEKVTIVIKSNHKLKETNADRIKNHTYYWDITKDNYKEKPISLTLYSDKYVWNYDNEILKRLILIILVIGGTVLLALHIYKIYKDKEDI